TDVDASRQSTHVQFAGNISAAVRDRLLRELAAEHGAYLTKMQMDIPAPSQISSDFTFGNAPNDEAFRTVASVDRDVAIPIELILLAGLVFGALIMAWLSGASGEALPPPAPGAAAVRRRRTFAMWLASFPPVSIPSAPRILCGKIAPTGPVTGSPS